MSSSPVVSSGLASPLLGEVAFKVQEASDELFGHSYASDKKDYRFNMLSHLVSRGHEGKVLCINASAFVDYIVSGGEDFTMRIWGYDASKTYYEFVINDIAFKGWVNKEADEPITLDHCPYPLTHQLQVTPVDEDGNPVIGQQRLLWVAIEGNCFNDEHGNKMVPFTTTVAHQASDSYRLLGVLMHDEELRETREEEPLQEPDEEGSAPAKPLGVTAVACAGRLGPSISGTSRGSVHLMQRGGAGWEVGSIRDFGVGRVNDFDVLEVQQREDAEIFGPWLLAVAGENGKLKLLQIHTSSGMLHWYEDDQVMEHEGPVLKVKQIWDGGNLGARFACCAGQDVYLWSSDCSLLTRLTMPEVPVMEDLAVTDRDNGTLLFAGANGRIGVWVIDPSAEQLPEEPLTVYRYNGKGIDVDQGSDLAEYAVHVRDDSVVVTWELLAARPECLIDPQSLSKWWELLIRPGKEKFVAEMVHQSPVTDFRVVEDDVEGPVLISANTNGTIYTFSMLRKDRGEICAQMRSLAWWEVALPPGLLMMTVFQLCSFAFGPSTMWQSKVKETVKYGTNIILFGTELSVELDIRASDKFWWELYVVSRLMGIFLLCEIAGAREVLNNARGILQSSESFKAAELAGTLSPLHIVRRLVDVVQRSLSLMCWLCCTVGVAPMFKVCGQAMRCTLDPEVDRYFLDVTGGRSVECSVFLGQPVALYWKGDRTWSFSPVMLLLLALIYLCGLIPYAVVGGDSTYVQRDEVQDREAWVKNAERKATALYMGIFHPNPRHVFKSQLLELLSKAGLPLITWLVAHPLLQMSLSTCLMAVLFAESLAYRAYIDEMYCAIVRGSRLFALCAMLCGTTTVVLGHSRTKLPVLLLCLSFISVGAHTTWQALQLRTRHNPIFRGATSESLKAPEP